MSHVKVLPCFMFFYVLIFVAVELFWHIGDMERMVFTLTPSLIIFLCLTSSELSTYYNHYSLLNLFNLVYLFISWYLLPENPIYRIPMTVDHFIGGLEDGLLDLALVLKQGRAKCKTFITNEYFNENETRIQQGRTNFSLCFDIKVFLATNMEKDGMNLISSNESLATLSKYDVQETFDNDKIKEKYSQFEKFVEVRNHNSWFRLPDGHFVRTPNGAV